MTNATVVTPWTAISLFAGATANVPLLQTVYAVTDFTDITRAPPNPAPNLYAIQCTMADTVAATLFADLNWTDSILTMDGPGNQRPAAAVPPDSEFTAICAAFVAAENANGIAVTLAEVQAALGTTANGRTRQQIANVAVAYLATLQPAG